MRTSVVSLICVVLLNGKFGWVECYRLDVGIEIRPREEKKGAGRVRVVGAA
jgi:hypothetical protein